MTQPYPRPTPYISTPAAPKQVRREEVVEVPTKNPVTTFRWWGSVVAIVSWAMVVAVRKGWLPEEIREPIRELSLEVVAGVVGTLNVEEAAAYLHLTNARAFKRRAREHGIRGVRVGRRWIYSKGQLDVLKRLMFGEELSRDAKRLVRAG